MTRKFKVIFFMYTIVIVSFANVPQKLKAEIKQKDNNLIIKISEDTRYLKEEEKSEKYLIKKGDTLSEIALKYRKTIKEIARDNNIKNVDLIITGDILIIK